MDGVLTIAPQSMVSLATPTGQSVVAPRREPEIATQDEWPEASTLALASYEVEIVGALSSGSTAIHVRNPGPLSMGIRRPKKVTPLPLQQRPKPRPPLASHTSGANVLARTSSGLAKRPHPVTAGPRLASSPVSKRGRKQVFPSKNPLLSSKRRPGIVPPSVNVATKPRSNDTAFEGAVGTIDVPHSISSVLKPHQRSGIVFLWNCLNGNGEVSPHAEQNGDTSDLDSYKGGCILADEMGLGKTLMTIATICALYRQRRDRVSCCWMLG